MVTEGGRGISGHNIIDQKDQHDLHFHTHTGGFAVTEKKYELISQSLHASSNLGHVAKVY